MFAPTSELVFALQEIYEESSACASQAKLEILNQK